MGEKYDESRFICPLERAGGYVVGGDISRIFLCRDGAGPMGWYDRIHIFWGDDEEPGLTMPAHNVDSWQ